MFRAEHFLPVDVGGSGVLREQPVDVERRRHQAVDVRRDVVDSPLLSDPEESFKAVVDAVGKTVLRKRADGLRRR